MVALDQHLVMDDGDKTRRFINGASSDGCRSGLAMTLAQLPCNVAAVMVPRCLTNEVTLPPIDHDNRLTLLH